MKSQFSHPWEIRKWDNWQSSWRYEATCPEIILVLDITHGFNSGSSTPGINAQRDHDLQCLSGDQIYCSLETGKSPAPLALRTSSPGSVLPPESLQGAQSSPTLPNPWPRSCGCDPQVPPKQSVSESVINYLGRFQNSSLGFVPVSDSQCKEV